MLAPTPLLRPSPLDISGLFAGTFEAMKRRIGLFLLISLLPLLVGAVLIGAGVAIAVTAAVAAAAAGFRAEFPAGVLVGVAILIVGIFASALLQLKSQAMLTLGAYEVAQGMNPDFRGLLERTRGFLPRMSSVILIAVAALIAFYTVFAFLVFGIAGAAASGGRGSEAALGGLILVVVLIALLAVPLGFFIQTKLLYTIPAVAIEQVGGIDGLKRSWSLTRGAFWRTLGYYLLASLGVAALSYVISLVSQVATAPALVGLDNVRDPAEAVAALAATIPIFMLLMGLQLVVQLVATPFLQIYVTYMFIDQVRRAELPAGGYYGTTPAYGYHQGAPAQSYPPPGQGYPPPNQGYPQPGQSYPPQPGQGYPPPNPGYPQPGTGYPPPNQGYPAPGQPGQWPGSGGQDQQPPR